MIYVLSYQHGSWRHSDNPVEVSQVPQPSESLPLGEFLQILPCLSEWWSPFLFQTMWRARSSLLMWPSPITSIIRWTVSSTVNYIVYDENSYSLYSILPSGKCRKTGSPEHVEIPYYSAYPEPSRWEVNQILCIGIEHRSDGVRIVIITEWCVITIDIP